MRPSEAAAGKAEPLVKKILIAVLVVLVVLVGGSLVLPSLIDWNTYKAQIAERVSAATGRAVELRGDLSLSLLPSPALTVRDARLANATGAAEPDMARLKKLDVRVALGPLLGGRIQVESITLVEPTFVVEVLPDGRVNWDLSGGNAGAPKQGRSGDGLAAAVSFDQVTVQNGTVLYRDARNGRSERIESLDARVVAGSLTGPFQLQGGFRLHAMPLRGEVTTGRFTEGAAVPIRASLGLADTDATLRFAGIVSASASGGGLKAQGDLRAEGGDLSRAIGSGGREALPALAQPFNLRTTIEAGMAGASFANLEVQLGDTRATGSAVMRTGSPAQAEVTLALNRLDLDGLLARSGTPGQTPGLPAVPAVPATLQLPDGIDVRLDLAADALTYNGAVIRQGRLESSLTGGRLSIDRLSALLPGGSDIVAAGEVTTPAGVPTLDLRMEANADNLRALLDWAKLDTRAFPPDRLRRASLAGRFQGTPKRFELGGIDLRVDTSRLTGAVAYVDRGRPAFGARLELDRLNLDAYLPAASSPAAPVGGGRTGGGLPAVARQPDAKPAGVTELPLRLLREVDANLDLTIGSLTVRGLPLQGMHVDATAAGGALTVREAKIDDFLGLKGRLDGQVAGLSPLRGVNLAVSGEAVSLGGLPRAVSWPAGIPAPERLGAVKFQARVAGDAAKLALELSAAAAGGTLDAGGSVTGLDGAPSADLKLRVGHPELGRLAALFADGQPPRAYGPLDLYGELSGSRAAPVLDNLQGIVAGVPMRGKLSAALDGPRPRLTAEVQTGDLDIGRLVAPPVLAPRGPATPADATPADQGPEQAIDVGWLRSVDGRLALTSSSLLVGERRIERPALRAAVENGVLTLEQLDGEFAGGQVGLTGRLGSGPGGSPTVEADLILVRAKLDQLAGRGGAGGFGLSGGTFDLDATLATAGATRSALLRGLSGNGKFAAQDGVLHGLDIAALRNRLTMIERPQELLGAVASGLNGGQSGFARMTGSFTVKDGVVRTEDTRVQSDLGEATAAGQVSLPEQTVDMRLRVAVSSDQPVPPLSGRVSGPLAAPSRSFDMREVQDYFARRAADAVLRQAVPQTGLPGIPAEPEKLLRGLIDGLAR